jgi:hypothetical protein
MAYTTSGGLALEVDITGLDEVQVMLLIAEADDVINRYCRRSFGAQAQVDYIDGDDSNEIVLTHGPVVTFTSLVVDGVNSTDYILRGQKITLKTGHFHHGVANVVATYTWGESAVPASVGRASRLQARNFVLARKQLEWEKQADADLSVSDFDGFTPGAYTPRVRADSTGDDTVDALLSPFRKPSLGAV